MNLRANPVPERFHLPIEILATIINELASDTEDNEKTLAALAACRLASNTLCSLATPLFFSSIQLTDSVGLPDASCEEGLKSYKILSNRAKNLHQILSSDDIADSVKTLALHCFFKNLASPPNGSLISKILHRLPNIQTIALTAFYTESEEEFLRFSDLEKDFRSAVQTLCKSPNLTTLYLDNVDGFPITVIAACPNLRHLRLWCAELDVNLSFFPVHSQPLTLHSSSTEPTRHQDYSPPTWIHCRLTTILYIIGQTMIDRLQIFFARDSGISKSSTALRS